MEPRTVNEIIDSIFINDSLELLHAYRDELILTQPRMIYRVDGGAGDRYYYRIEEAEIGNSFVFYPSTTTFTKKVLPTSPFLLQWMKEQGEEADKVRDLAADFGTLMHICIKDFFVHGYDFGMTRELVAKYVEKLGHPKYLIGKWSQKLNKAMASFKQFCNDYEIEPILVEGMLASDEIGIAGTLDLICKMFTPELAKSHKKAINEYEKALAKWEEGLKKAIEKGKEPDYADFTLEFPERPEKVIGNVDFKSGGIYESSGLQLAINTMIFHDNFPDLKIEILLNWSPNDYITNPTYTVKDWTNSQFTYEVINAFITIYGAMYPEEVQNKKVFEFTGRIENDLKPVSQNVGLTTLYKSIENSYNQRQSA